MEFESKVTALESERALMALGIWIPYLHTIQSRKSFSVLEMIKEVLKVNDHKQDTISKRNAMFIVERLQSELELTLRNMKSLGRFCDPPDTDQHFQRLVKPVGPNLSGESAALSDSP